MSQPLPNWLMLGAPRTGSTALDEALRQHPDFFLPAGKETHFFSNGGDAAVPAMQTLGIPYRIVSAEQEYKSLFEGSASFPQRGEVDPSILACAPYAIPKIRALLGDSTRYIVVLRQPVERSYSHYLLHRRYSLEHQSFESYVGVTMPRTPAERVALDRYFGNSFYFDNLNRFMQAFRRAQFLVLLYDDLQTDPHGLMQRILEFLNADTRHIPSLTPETNAGKVPTTFRGRFRAPTHPLRRFLRACVPLSLRAQMRQTIGWNQRATDDFKKLTLNPSTRATLMTRYREDILRTQDLIQRDLSPWLL